MVSAEGIRPDPAKIAGVREAPFPESRKDMHHWVSLANYYAQFIPDFALLTAPLQDYVHAQSVKGKDGKRVQPPPSQEVRDAFAEMQRHLCSDLLLVRPDFNKPFRVICDAAKKVGGCGTVLAQLDDRGVERAVSMWSVRWLDATANWAPVEHECYALLLSLIHI